MLVAQDGCYGTVGGGQLEYMAIDEARALLRQDGERRTMDIPLGPEIGQCCGGHVTLSIVMLDEKGRQSVIDGEIAERAGFPTVYVFGCGHVGRALADAFSLLPVRPVVIDPRAEELEFVGDHVEKRLTPVPEQVVRDAEPGSAFVILTHDHSLDFLIACEALARTDAAYVGMIGSRTKRATFERWCRKAAELAVDTRALTCPIGATVSKDKRPEVIAAFVAAEVIEKLTSSEGNSEMTSGEMRAREKSYEH